MAERIHWLTERSLELCLLEWLQWLQWSPHRLTLQLQALTGNRLCSYRHATNYACSHAIMCNELPLLLRPRACNELQLLLRHRAVRKNTHAGEVRLRFETITCNELPRHAMNYSCCCAIVRSEKTHTLPNLNCSVVVVLVVAVVVV